MRTYRQQTLLPATLGGVNGFGILTTTQNAAGNTSLTGLWYPADANPSEAALEVVRLAYKQGTPLAYDGTMIAVDQENIAQGRVFVRLNDLRNEVENGTSLIVVTLGGEDTLPTAAQDPADAPL